jgi:hypothetical protein
MTYTITFSFYRPSKAGLTLAAQLIDTDFNDTGSEITSFADEPYSDGWYDCVFDAIPDDHQGFMEIYESGARASGPICKFAINPSEVENADVKTSTRSDGTGITLADDAITAAKYDQSTAYPLTVASIPTAVWANTTRTLTSGQALVAQSPVSSGGTVETYQGGDYSSADSLALTWSISGLPTVTGGTPTVYVNGTSFAGAAVGSAVGGTVTATIELSATQTAAIAAGLHKYVLQITQTDGDVIPAAYGEWYSYRMEQP